MRTSHRNPASRTAITACALLGLTLRFGVAAGDPADWPTFGGDNTRTHSREPGMRKMH